MNINNTRKVLSFIINMLNTTKSTVPLLEFQEKKPIFTEKQETFFERVSPEVCGISSKYVENFIQELLKNKNVALQSIMLMKDNKVFFEGDVDFSYSHLPKATFSECKSIVSLAIGALVTHGRLRLNEKIVDIFGNRINSVSKLRLKSLTVRHLLTMTSCITFNEIEAMTTNDWVAEFLNSDTDGIFGGKFKYNSLNTYLLSAIVIERSGMSLCEYLDSTIFGALKITDYYWEKCPNGIEKGGWGLYIRREDLAKIGILVMQQGVWNDRRLISKRYIEDATRCQIETPTEYGDYNYGFQFWVGKTHNIFLLNGMFGQNLLGFRDSNILIIANCGNADLFQKNDFFEICHRYFGADFCEDFQEIENFNQTEKSFLLKQHGIESFLDNKKAERCFENDLLSIDGKHFIFNSKNAVSAGFAPLFLQIIQANFTKGLLSVAFSKNDQLLDIEFEEHDETHRITVGFEKPEKNTVVIHGEPFIVIAQGEFCVNEDGIPVLKVECRFVETPFTRSFKFFFEKGCYHALLSESPGMEISHKPQIFLGLLEESGEKIENLFDKFDGDYLGLKLENAFAPRLTMIEQKDLAL